MIAVQLSDARRTLVEKYLQGNSSPTSSSASVITRRRSDRFAPLSPTQEGIWRNAQRQGVPPFYNESITIHRKGPLDPLVLEQSLLEILRRHESWRTTFDMEDGQPVQIIHRTPDSFPLAVIDLRTSPSGERDQAAQRAAKKEVERPFDLREGPLVRGTLVRLDDEEYRLYMAIHQIIIDGVTAYHIFLPELAVLYEAFSKSKPSPLPELPVQYADVSSWQRNWLQGELQTQLAYWRKRLSGELPVLQWPNDHARPSRQTFRGTFRPFSLPQDLSRTLNDFSQREGVTLFVTLLSGFFALLHWYTKQRDIIIGTVSRAGRKRAEAQQLLGYFLIPLPLRLDLSGDPTVRELLLRVQKVSVGALSHDDVPFETLVETLQPTNDPSRNPFFQVAASLEPPLPNVNPSWSLTPMDIESGGGRWDVYLVWDDRPTGIIGRVQYNPDLLEPPAITEMLRHQELLLQKLAADPHQRLSQLAISV